MTIYRQNTTTLRYELHQLAYGVVGNCTSLYMPLNPSQIAYGSSNGKVYVLRARNTNEYARAIVVEAHNTSVRGVAITTSGIGMVTLSDSSVKFWLMQDKYTVAQPLPFSEGARVEWSNFEREFLVVASNGTASTTYTTADCLPNHRLSSTSTKCSCSEGYTWVNGGCSDNCESMLYSDGFTDEIIGCICEDSYSWDYGFDNCRRTCSGTNGTAKTNFDLDEC